MFVRWKKRATAVGYALSAHLVKAVRINGKPRHQVIAHLCTLRSSTMQQLDPWLWHQVEARLDTLEIDEPTRERICQAIAQKTPRATPEQMQEAAAAHEQRMAQIAAFFQARTSSPPPPVPPPAIAPEVAPRGAYQVQWKWEPPATYRVFLVKLTPQHGRTRREIICRLASIGEQPLHKQLPWAWREFWFSVHCALYTARVTSETYWDVIMQLSQWLRSPSPEELGLVLLEKLTSEMRRLDGELRSVYQRQDRLWQRLETLKEIREAMPRYAL